MANNRLIIVNDDIKAYTVIGSHSMSPWRIDGETLKQFLESIWDGGDETYFRLTTEMGEEDIYNNKEYTQVYDLKELDYIINKNYEENKDSYLE